MGTGPSLLRGGELGVERSLRISAKVPALLSFGRQIEGAFRDTAPAPGAGDEVPLNSKWIV
jgi:hypothetical protein